MPNVSHPAANLVHLAEIFRHFLETPRPVQGQAQHAPDIRQGFLISQALRQGNPTLGVQGAFFDIRIAVDVGKG